nr:hypothetical protein [Candidatus Sigynarchaeota archaeon]
MAKKPNIENLLGGIIQPGKLEQRRAADEQDAAAQAKKEPGLLDPIMAILTAEEKFLFLSSLMDFLGDFLVRMLDNNNFELTKVENSISAMQSTVLNQVRTIRNQIDIARQQGHFKVQQLAQPFAVPGQLPMDRLAAATAAAEEPQKKRQATERDVMDIAASIRTLITRQKMGKGPGTEALKEPPSTVENIAPATPAAPTAAPKASLDSKLEQFQKSADEQKQRMDKMAAVAKPAAPALTASTKAPKSKPAAQKPSTKAGKKATTKPAAVKPGAVKPPVTAPGETKLATGTVPGKKLDKEKDLLPKGFQQELMKNIKGLIRDKDKDGKKT